MSSTMVQTAKAPPAKGDKPRPKRSQTVAPSSSSPTTGAIVAGSEPPKPRRSHSQDQQPKMSSSGRPKKEKKASMHADIIDMMDPSGSGMFHHDGPFDAVAPSRNRQRTRAPLGVFDGDVISPEGPYPAPHIAVPIVPPRPLHTRARSSTAQAAAPTGPSVSINPAYISAALPPDKKKNAVAEAWGIADPEPFEEFSAGGAYAAHAAPAPVSSSAPSASRTPYNDYWNEGDAVRNASRNARRARPLPPPQQIMLPGSNFNPSAYRADESPPSDEKAPSPTSPTGAYPGISPPRMKRTKSLMQRIRTMRDNPNVPVGAPDPHAPDPVSPYGYQYPTSPSMEEPMPILYAQQEEMQNSYSNASFERETRSNGKKAGLSLFNRLTRSPRVPGLSASPPVSPTEENGFVMVHGPREKDKALPSLPRAARSPPVTGSGYEKDGYFDRGQSSGGMGGVTPGTPYTPGGGAPLGRRRSLLSKMKGAPRK